MAIRSAKQRRSCTLNELVNWVLSNEIHISQTYEDRWSGKDFERARADIHAALRDGQIQPLGYRVDRTAEKALLKGGFAVLGSDVPKPEISDVAERIRSAFWAHAEIDWQSSRAQDLSVEFVSIHFLMDEVRRVWSSGPEDTIEAESSLVVTSEPLVGPVGTALIGTLPIATAVPASDRVVRRDDNSAAFDEAAKALDDATTAFEKANDIGDLTAGERNVILSEFKAWKGILEEAQVRISTFVAKLKPTIELVMAKVGDEAAREAARRALGAFLKFLGFGS